MTIYHLAGGIFLAIIGTIGAVFGFLVILPIRMIRTNISHALLAEIVVLVAVCLLMLATVFMAFGMDTPEKTCFLTATVMMCLYTVYSMVRAWRKLAREK
jgi:hypothetical protein